VEPEISAAEADNPLYIQNMYKDVQGQRAVDRLRELYNCPLVHRLHPETRSEGPRALPQLWSEGQ
jgi:hypothetical protein